jgi:hypothetical protein
MKQIKLYYQGVTDFMAHSGWKVGVKADVGKLRPAGQIRPAKTFCPIREGQNLSFIPGFLTEFWPVRHMKWYNLSPGRK